MTTGYNIREGAAILTARVLRDPSNWPSVAEDSEILRKHIALARRCGFERGRLRPFLARYERRAA